MHPDAKTEKEKLEFALGYMFGLLCSAVTHGFVPKWVLEKAVANCGELLPPNLLDECKKALGEEPEEEILH